MKHIYIAKLQLNKFTNVLKYMILIIAFVFVRGEIVRGVSCDSEYSYNQDRVSAKCHEDEQYTYVNGTQARIPLYVEDDSFWYDFYGGEKISFRICDYQSSTDNCKTFSLIVGDPERVVTAADLIMSRKTGAIRWNYLVGSEWVYDTNESYSSDEYTNFLNSYNGSRYQTNGFRLEVIITVVDPDMYQRRVCDYGKCVTFYDAGFTSNLTYAGWDIEPYYLFDKNVSIVEKDENGINIGYEYRKSHSPTIVTSNVSPSSKIYYCWLSQFVESYANVNWTGATCNNVTGNTTTITKNTGDDLFHLYVKVEYNVLSETYSLYNIGYFYFDNTAPVLSYTYQDISDYRKNFTAQEPIMRDGGGSGVFSKEYCWSTQTSITGTCPTGYTEHTISDETGTYYFFVKGTDYAGNVSGWIKVMYVNLDNTGPTLNISDDGFDHLNGKSEWLDFEATFVVDFNDSAAGFGDSEYPFKYCWYKSTETKCTPNIETQVNTGGSASIQYPSSSTGKYHLVIYAYDRLGNKTEVFSSGTNTYYVDNDSPTISGFEGLPNDGEARNSYSTLVYVDDHDGSGIIEVYYRWKDSSGNFITAKYNVLTSLKVIANSTSKKFTASINSTTKSTNGSTAISGLNGNVYLYVYVKDKTGNVSEKTTSNNIVFDIVAPTINITWKKASKTTSVEQVSEMVMMSYESNEVIEVEEESKEVIEEMIKGIEVKEVEEKEVVKAVSNEIVKVNHVHVPDRVSVYDYIISLNISVVVGSYLFVKERKRINVS